MDNAIRANSTEIRDSVGLLNGLLIGGLAGAVTMLLMAPQSGKKTRAQIRQRSTDLQDRTIDTFDDLVALPHFDNRKILAGTHGKLKIDSLIRSSYG
jgi:gas vesicle protein